MANKKFIDPDGLKTCTKCEKTYEASTEYFHKNAKNICQLNCVCKSCDNLRRTNAQKNRKYHNIRRKCIECNDFFWASRADMNKLKRKNGRDGGIYCSKECQFKGCTREGWWGRKGKSWDGKRQGINNPNHKYPIYLIIKVKLLIKDNKRNKDIASIINISTNYISRIRNGTAWSNLVV